MNEVYSKAVASIESVDDEKFGANGGFTAVLSTPSEDRDGDRLHRQEWKDFTQTRYPLDIDHGMSVAETVGSFVPYWDGDRMMMDAAFARTAKAQDVRALVTPDENGIRHISSVSVAFMTDKSKKDGEPRRELLNAGIVAVPSNRDAIILASKAASALKDAFSDATQGEVPDEVKAAVLEALGTADTKAANEEPYGAVEYADPGFQDDKVKRYPVNTPEHVRAAWSYIHQSRDGDKYSPEQRAHIEAVIRHAAEKFGINLDDSKSYDNKKATVYVNVVPRLDEDALKRVMAEVTKAATGGDGALVQAIHDASSHLGAACPVMEPDVDPDSGASSGANKSAEDPHKLEAFEKALDQALTPESTPEAPAPTDEVPAPASPADEKAKRTRHLQMLQMQAQLTHS